MFKICTALLTGGLICCTATSADAGRRSHAVIAARPAGSHVTLAAVSHVASAGRATISYQAPSLGLGAPALTRRPHFHEWQYPYPTRFSSGSNRYFNGYQSDLYETTRPVLAYDAGSLTPAHTCALHLERIGAGPAARWRKHSVSCDRATRHSKTSLSPRTRFSGTAR